MKNTKKSITSLIPTWLTDKKYHHMTSETAKKLVELIAMDHDQFKVSMIEVKQQLILL